MLLASPFGLTPMLGCRHLADLSRLARQCDSMLALWFHLSIKASPHDLPPCKICCAVRRPEVWRPGAILPFGFDPAVRILTDEGSFAFPIAETVGPSTGLG